MSNFLLKNDIKQIVENLRDISNYFSDKTILLTGGRGFLGRYFMSIFNLLNKKVLKEKKSAIQEIVDILIESFKCQDTLEDQERNQRSHHCSLRSRSYKYVLAELAHFSFFFYFEISSFKHTDYTLDILYLLLQ